MSDIVITRAISLTQPWATLVAIGAKRIETRSWATSYRGWIGIHASKAFPGSCRYQCWSPAFARRLAAADYNGWPELPTGALVGAVRLTDVLTAPQPGLAPLGSEENEFGNFADGRKLWLLADAHRILVPQPMRGALSVWTLPRSFAIEQFARAA